MNQQWKPIESAPQTGRTLLLGYRNSRGNWRTVRGQWMSAAYIAEFWEEPDDVEEGWFETSAEADDTPNCWRVTPSHWMPLPAAPGTPPASAQDDAKDERQAFETWFTRNDETKVIADRAVRRCATSGAYVLMQTYTAWEIWRAARASVAAPASVQDDALGSLYRDSDETICFQPARDFHVTDGMPVFAAPAAGDARAWQGLTDAEQDGYVGELVGYGTDFVSPLYSVVESIEKRLREKNAASQQQEG